MHLKRHNRRQISSLLDLLIGVSQFLKKMSAGILEIQQVVSVVDNRHLVCFRITNGYGCANFHSNLQEPSKTIRMKQWTQS